MTTVTTPIGYLKFDSIQTWVEEDFIKANLVDNNYGFNRLSNDPVLRRSSESFDYDISNYESKFWRQIQILVHIVMRELEHDNKLAPTVLGFFMLREHYDFKIVCAAYQAEWLTA